MKIKENLRKFDLTPDNSIVIGAGILEALKIRESQDIDVTVDKNTYELLKKSGYFKKTKTYGREILVDDIFEIGTDWEVLNKNWKFEDLLDHSVVIDGIRYINLDFLLSVKQSWLSDEKLGPKALKDIELIENYVEKNILTE